MYYIYVWMFHTVLGEYFLVTSEVQGQWPIPNLKVLAAVHKIPSSWIQNKRNTFKCPWNMKLKIFSNSLPHPPPLFTSLFDAKAPIGE